MAKILVTNDDGVHADGLQKLVDALQGIADIWVSAPDGQRSGVGHGLTLYKPLHVHHDDVKGAHDAIVVSGTPADAVKFAITRGYRDIDFDLVVSGINHGPNAGTNVLYSGTVAGALEGLICGVSAMAVSLDIGVGEPDFSLAAPEAARVVKELLASPLPPGIAINMNVPHRTRETCKGTKITRMGVSGFREVYNHSGKEDDGRERFHIDGEFLIHEETLEYDAVALKEGYISLTPLQLDMTARGDLGSAETWAHLAGE